MLNFRIQVPSLWNKLLEKTGSSGNFRVTSAVFSPTPPTSRTAPLLSAASKFQCGVWRPGLVFQGLWGEHHLDCGHPSPFSIIHIDILGLLDFAELSLCLLYPLLEKGPHNPDHACTTCWSPWALPKSTGARVQKIKSSLSGYVWPYFILD